ncbi:50S ribosomal L9 [Chlorella sorokiniana]|uniref:Large ribosomal subunit protein bL9c n=1 Tax=Chlorella sorokiniana TaxID=3076 RepID=A0A2P6TYM9_CHLSO|nr:50S ribosomal L9 [Chlorella sorokiniana]|eukprot:PRW59172.1 50S ribosomal L9 [Chlorella sorokiniana]
MQRAAQRASELLGSAAYGLQQLRGAKAVTTKLTVEMLEDVEGVAAAGTQARVNHGYARNFLVPNKLARVVPRPRRGAAALAAAEAAAAAPRSAPGEPTLERQQQQFDKLMKTLTGSTLTLKRRTLDGQKLETPLAAQDVADAVAKQLRIRLVPEMVDLGGETLSVVGEYRLPLKMVLPSGDRVALDLTVAST